MKKLTLLFSLLMLISFGLNSQNLFDKYEKIEIVSDSRIIIELEINNKKCFVLIDTGSSVSILDIQKTKIFDYDKNGKYPNPIIGVNNSVQYMYYVKNASVKIGKISTFQFVVGNISNIRDIIKNETGYEICGIIGYHTIKEVGLILNPLENIVYIRNKNN